MTPLLLRFHHAAGVLHRQKIAEQIHVHHRAPFFRVGLGNRLGNQDGGVGDDDVHAAKFRHRAIKQFFNVRFLRHVGFQRERLRPVALTISAAVACAASSFMSAMATWHRPSPARRQIAWPESLRAAGDDGDFVFEWKIHWFLNNFTGTKKCRQVLDCQSSAALRRAARIRNARELSQSKTLSRLCSSWQNRRIE